MRLGPGPRDRMFRLHQGVRNRFEHVSDTVMPHFVCTVCATRGIGLFISLHADPRHGCLEVSEAAKFKELDATHVGVAPPKQASTMRIEDCAGTYCRSTKALRSLLSVGFWHLA